MYQFSWEYAIGTFTVLTILALICLFLPLKVRSKIAKREAENTHLHSQMKLAVIPACVSLMYWFFLNVCDILTRCFEGYELGSILSYLGNTGWTIIFVAIIGSLCFPTLQRKLIGSSAPVYVDRSTDEAVNLLNFTVSLVIISIVSICNKDYIVSGTILAFVFGHFVGFDKIYKDDTSEKGKLKKGFNAQPKPITISITILTSIYWCIVYMFDSNPEITNGILLGFCLFALLFLMFTHFDPLKRNSKAAKR